MELSCASAAPKIISVKPNPGARVYAVGDVHGCAYELRTMLDHLISTDLLTSRDTIIFLGDYIDRGNDSRGVIEAACDVKEAFPFAYFLLGNHEQMLIEYLLGGPSSEHYLNSGGRACLLSYGFRDEDISSETLTGDTSRLGLLPERHLNFLNNLVHGIIVDRFFLVHAGVEPTKSVERQSVQDLLWIRERFVSSPTNVPYTVVFGHTPFDAIVIDLPWKIGIDTGLVYGNSLTILELRSFVYYQIKLKAQRVETGKIVPS